MRFNDNALNMITGVILFSVTVSMFWLGDSIVSRKTKYNVELITLQAQLNEAENRSKLFATIIENQGKIIRQCNKKDEEDNKESKQ